ncbi:unnamed protein product [Haemonchus placei]|uniref:Uncharacterized protein n=1 Tax=Haemonchus placei TaxID=6290 RepID=A0A158QNL9_HAEPC|nr:unnamed protein product [Haemonchus placei]
MLGMMNSPADTVEFYAARRSSGRDEGDDDDLKVFTEVKQKRSVTYMQDGRRMIDGKIEPGSSETAMSLWETTLRRGAITTQMMPTADNDDQPAGEGSKRQAEESCPETTKCSNPVVVYAPNKRHGEGLSEEHLKSFTEVKPRQTVTYTKDGRRMIDGKVEDTDSGDAARLWEETLRRGVITTKMISEDKKQQKDKDKKEKEKCCEY